MAIAGNSSQGNSRIFQARQYHAIPGKVIRYKKIPDNFRQEILGKAFATTPAMSILASLKQDNSRQGSHGQFQRTQFLVRSFHACAYIKIFGNSTADNSRQGKSRKHNVRKNNSKQLQEIKFQTKKF